MKDFKPLFPELHKSKVVCYNVEMEWGFRKYEIKTILLRFLRQRESAYKACDQYSVSRQHQIFLIKAAVKDASALYSEKYIIAIQQILLSCNDIMPLDQKFYIHWASRFAIITNYCNSFIQKFHENFS